MELELFLNALKTIGSSPYALTGYVVVAIIWGINLWRNHKLKIIATHLKSLPQKDRLKALELEYKLLPKGGLNAESYIRFTSKQNYLIIALVTIAAIVLIVSLAVYKSIEEKKLLSTVNSLTVALEVTKLGKFSANNNEFAISAGNLESVLKMYPSANGYMNLGYVYEEISDTEASLLAYQKALKLEPNNPKILNALGYLYKDLGKFDKASELLQKAIQNSTVGNDVWFIAMANAGNVIYEIGRKTNDIEKREIKAKKALAEYFVPAIKYKASIKNQDFIAKTLANMGNCYKDIKQFAKAQDHLTEAIAIKRKLAASRSLADTLNNMADLYLKQNRFKEAKPFLIEAMAIFNVTGNELGIGVIYYNLGDIHWAIGEVKEAQSYYKRSVDSFSIASLGGEYKQAPRRRLKRMTDNNTPKFVIKSWERLGLTSQ